LGLGKNQHGGLIFMLVKKIIASSILTSLSCSSVVFAAGMFPNAWKESDEGIWQAYVEGQFVHQSNNLARADSIIVPIAAVGGSKAPIGPGTVTNGTPLLDGDPDQDWGFGFGLGYVFASKKYDVRANYFALRSDKNQSATQAFAFAGTGTGTPAFNGTTTSEKNYYDYSEADITFGNFIHLSKRLTMRLGYGLEFADIKQHSRSSSLIANNPVVIGGSDVDFDQNFKNEFKGVGPLFTVDGQYDITKYIAVVGAVGASALYGTSRAEYHSTSTSTSGSFIGAGQETFDFEEEEHKIALGLDTRLGLRFSKVVSRDAALNVEAGYEGVAYLNALQDGNFGNVTGATNTGRFLATGVNNYSFEDDYNNYGPYVRVGVDFK
jgi:hypothetical protein